MFEEAVEIRDRLAVLVDRLDPDAFSGSAARELWAVLDKSERLCAAGKTLLARRVAATHQRCGGTRTAAEELGRRGGTSTGAAKDAVDTSARLPDQPELANALRGGALSPAQAALISAAVAANPSVEKRLVELAGQVSLAELREECARVRAAADPDPDATNRRLHNARQLRRYTDSEGFWNLHAKGSPQAGAAFNAVLDPIIDQIFGHARRTGRHEHPDAYGFDALMAMADQAADHAAEQAAESAAGDRHNDPTEQTAPEATPDDGDAQCTVGAADVGSDGVTDSADASPDAADAGQPGIFAAGRSQSGSTCRPAPRQSINPRYLALLRVDAAALRRGRVEGEELCEIAGVGPVPVSTAREVLGEAIVKLVITRGIDVLNVTHLGRGPTAAQRAALLWMNPTCAAQGCNRRRIEYDHQIPWADTHHTRLDELDPLCEFHHDLKTRLGYALVPGNGKRAFVPPDNPRHPARQPARAGPAASANGPASDAGRPPSASRNSRPSTRRRAFRQTPLPILVPDDP